MNSPRLALVVLGVLVLLAGVVFSLQGANIITGSSLMSGNTTYIYVGAIVAIIGLALLALSSRVGNRSASPTPSGVPQAP
ncbi:MAG TPA: hypothetical protein VED22_05240 [Nitrososphaerales archaeon]|nr:hypothetical protein [Nitrososphaerales archaeon]